MKSPKRESHRMIFVFKNVFSICALNIVIHLSTDQLNASQEIRLKEKTKGILGLGGGGGGGFQSGQR